MTIGERIAQLLDEQGKPAKNLARYLGIDASSVTGWVRGSWPSSKYIIKISQFLDVSVEWLLTGEVDKQAQKNVDADAITGISGDALRVAAVWDTLDEAGKAITMGEIYRRAEAISNSSLSSFEDADGLRKAT
jgi:transcriptional regulator with XRE-family HTH domain